MASTTCTCVYVHVHTVQQDSSAREKFCQMQLRSITEKLLFSVKSELQERNYLVGDHSGLPPLPPSPLAR